MPARNNDSYRYLKYLKCGIRFCASVEHKLAQLFSKEEQIRNAKTSKCCLHQFLNGPYKHTDEKKEAPIRLHNGTV